ncbi:BSD domain-containing protein 1-like isoform X1 [Planococcus citri]|uniref:BSD domain-containing protein 1-like isoform X1 n=1 Tax=Planococcus citri TaxID=170843 RepID=UPI0031F96778
MTEENRDKTEENKEDENSWSWKSWYSAAKNKSGEVFDYLKQDLNEISTTVKSEASSFLNTTRTAIVDGIQITNPEWTSATSTVKESVSSILSQVSSALSPQPCDGDEEPFIVENDKIVSISKFQSKLYLLSADTSTYLKDIEETLSTRYSAWLESLKHYEFDPLSNEKLTKLLLTNSRLKENYEKLVPEQVSHGEFWNRFLFRKALLEDEEAEKVRKKSVESKIADSLHWDKETLGSHLSLSEEEQNQLLKEYEEELSSISTKPETIETTKDEITKQILTSSATNSISEGSSAQSLNDRESSSDDWEKDFDIEEIPQNV